MSNEQPLALRLAEALDAQATWVPSGPAGVMHRAAAELRRLRAALDDAQAAESVAQAAAERVPLTDEQQIAEALRRHGLTLVKTATGYDVLKLGQITAARGAK